MQSTLLPTFPSSGLQVIERPLCTFADLSTALLNHSSILTSGIEWWSLLVIFLLPFICFLSASFAKFIICYVCRCYVCMCTSVCHMCAVPREAKRGQWIPCNWSYRHFLCQQLGLLTWCSWAVGWIQVLWKRVLKLPKLLLLVLRILVFVSLSFIFMYYDE